MERETRDRLYFQFEKMGFKLAKKFSAHTNIPFEDLIQDVRFILINYLEFDWERCYNPKKGSESTWMYLTLYHQLQNVILGRSKYNRVSKEVLFSTLPEDQIPDPIAPTDYLESVNSNLSHDAQTLIDSIINTPEAIADSISVRKCKKAREAIKGLMINEKDWDRVELENVWEEVSAAI